MNNTLKYVKVLEGVGITREQAEAHVQLVTDIMEGDLATKQDMRSLEIKLDTKFDTFAERLEHKMIQLEYRLFIKLGTTVSVVIATVAAVITLYEQH